MYLEILPAREQSDPDFFQIPLFVNYDKGFYRILQF